jgi:translation initiation factor 1
MSKRRSKPSASDEADQPLVASPFAGLEGLRSSLPAGELPAEELGGKEPDKESARAPRRAVIRYQRKGRGGKEVTRVEQLGLSRDELSRWLKDLRRELGCGGIVEGDALALQGDQRLRLRPLLERRGIKRISSS